MSFQFFNFLLEPPSAQFLLLLLVGGGRVGEDCQVDVPEEGHEVGKENPELDGNKVDVDDLGQGPDLPVGKQRGQGPRS